MNTRFQWRKLLYPLFIIMAWFLTSTYTFNRKADLNGDNIFYYITATSLASGNGYADLSRLDNPDTEFNEQLTSTYPPGYPILMTPLRCITDSVVAQKWMNELFVLFSLILLYFLLLRIGIPASMSFVAAFSCAFIPRLLHFSTMMMSEASFCLTGIIVLYFLLRASEDEDKWYGELKKPWIWLAVVFLVLNYHIRTQGLALLAGAVFGLLLRKRWAAAGVTVAGFSAGCLPWMLRNKLCGLSNTRYLDMVMQANPWRPEEGYLTVPEFLVRMVDTMKMLIFNALPSSVIPFAKCDCDNPSFSAGLYILGGVILCLIVAGCFKLGKIKWITLGYIAASFFLISSFSTPSGNRYVTSILPLLTATELIGLWSVILFVVRHLFGKTSVRLSCAVPFAFLLLLFFAGPGLKFESKFSRQPYPLQYTHFFNLGKMIDKNAPKDAVVCSRKPQMLWLHSKRPSCGYLSSTDSKKVIVNMIDNKVDYVILDALGYSSTGLYLYPAVRDYSRFFNVVYQYEKTHTYLLYFDRKKAKSDLETE